jgi:hypothetical protein
MTQMNVGGGAVSPYIAESGFTASSATNALTPDTSGVTSPAPDAVYQSCRYSLTSFTKTLSGLTPGGLYLIRSHSMWYSTNWTMGIKGQRCSKGLIVFHLGHGRRRRKGRGTFNATADGSGEILLEWTADVTLALVSALEWDVLVDTTPPSERIGAERYGPRTVREIGMDAGDGRCRGVALPHPERYGQHVQLGQPHRHRNGGRRCSLLRIRRPQHDTLFPNESDRRCRQSIGVVELDRFRHDGQLTPRMRINCGGSATGSWLADHLLPERHRSHRVHYDRRYDRVDIART